MKIMVLHMGRSGGHAILEWVCKNLVGKITCHVNCTEGWSNKEFVQRRIVKEYGLDGDHSTVMSIEDFYIPLWKKYGMDNWNQKFDKVILVVRSPRNWLASSIAAQNCTSGGYMNECLDIRVPVYGNYEIPTTRIRAYLKYLKLHEFAIEKFDIGIRNGVFVNYDKWILDDEYRIDMSKTIGLLSDDKPGNCVFSSFGNNHDYTGNRYELLNEKQKERFNKLYNNSKLRFYQEKYWG